jgi:hypothetical protein
VCNGRADGAGHHRSEKTPDRHRGGHCADGRYIAGLSVTVGDASSAIAIVRLATSTWIWFSASTPTGCSVPTPPAPTATDPATTTEAMV